MLRAGTGSAQTNPALSDNTQAPPMVPYTELVRDFPDMPFSQLSDQTISAHGRRALAINPQNWKHGETRNFVLHYIQNHVAKEVAMESESYFRYIAADLNLAPSDSGKNHIFIFEDALAWETFLVTTRLELWTGAVTIGMELFVPRNPKYKFKGHALGHEIVHLMVHRFVGTKLPLWLEEGIAEDLSMTAYSSYYRRRGYSGRVAKPGLKAFIPLAQLTAITAYPSDNLTVETFYTESNWLAGYLNSFENRGKFSKMFRAMAAQGVPFESALRDEYSSKWSSISDLERDFKAYLSTAGTPKR